VEEACADVNEDNVAARFAANFSLSVVAIGAVSEGSVPHFSRPSLSDDDPHPGIFARDRGRPYDAAYAAMNEAASRRAAPGKDMKTFRNHQSEKHFRKAPASGPSAPRQCSARAGVDDHLSASARLGSSAMTRSPMLPRRRTPVHLHHSPEHSMRRIYEAAEGGGREGPGVGAGRRDSPAERTRIRSSPEAREDAISPIRRRTVAPSVPGLGLSLVCSRVKNRAERCFKVLAVRWSG